MTFHPEAVTPTCLAALNTLRGLSFIDSFYLAGGTALALQLGHRISTDLDWFSTTRLLNISERELISQELAAQMQLTIVSEQDGMLFTRLEGADISFLHQRHPLLEAAVDFNGLQLASPIDIGVMKLAAVNSRGSRRDFVDLYSLRHIVTLDRLLELASIKYADRPDFLPTAARALAYFEDAEQQPMPRMLIDAAWDDIKRYCAAAGSRLIRRMSGLQ